jgi:hypothetical protein
MDFKSNTVRGEAKFRQFAYEVSLSLIRLNPSRWQVMGREYRYIYELVSGLVYQEKMGRPTIRLPIRPAGDDQTSVGVDRLIEFLHDVPILIASM